MTYTMHYDSPLGKILLAADEEGLTGVWLETQKHFAAKLPPEHEEGTTPVLGDACRWLDVCGGNFRARAEAFYGDEWAQDPACYLTDEEIGIK